MAAPQHTGEAATSAPSPAGGEVHLLDRLSVVLRHKRLAGGIFVAVAAWVMVDSYSTVPLYRATTRLQIEDDVAGIGTPTEIAQSVMVQDSEIYLQTQLRVIRGRELARRTAARLRLDTVPEFTGQGPQATAIARGIAAVKSAAKAPLRLLFGSTGGPAPSGAPGADDSAMARAFLDRIEVSPNRGTQLVDVSFVASDPAFAAHAVNTLADEYVAQDLALKVSSLEASLARLTAEVVRQQALVQDSELKLAEYREQQDAGALADNQNIVVARLTQLNEAVTKARTERIQREALWNQVQAAGADVDTLSVIVRNPFIQTLKAQVTELEREEARVSERYGNRHPDLLKVQDQLANARRQLQAEMGKAVQNARSDYENALAQEQTLSQALREQQGAASALGRKGVDYTVLQREAESNREIYNMLLQRERELRVIANSRGSNIHVLDRAEPPTAPFTPNHRQAWLYALLLASAMGIGAAFAADYLDETVRTPEDVSRRLKLRLLGLVPAVRDVASPMLSGPVPPDFREAYRALRTALTSLVPGPGPKLIAVTSARPLEGKTTTAVNLALILASGGARVLLIDADMRRPTVNKALGLSNERGLSQLLTGDARVQDVVQGTSEANLQVITSGPTPADPSELLASARMKALIRGFDTDAFDWVVFDTPPVLAVTDAVIVAPLVSAVTFVIGAEMTRWRLAQRAIDTLQTANPGTLAAVLNRADFGRDHHYYSRYYGYEYRSYYSESPTT